MLKVNKQKINKTLVVLVSVIILTIGSVIIAQIYHQHQANKRIIDECFEKFDTGSEIVVNKESFWSSVSCEKS